MSSNGEERRRHRRAAVDLVVKLRFGSLGELLEAHAGDLSVGGMFLRCEDARTTGSPRALGQFLTVEFDAGGDRVVEGRAKVVRVVPGAGIGVEFVDLDELSARLIEVVVAESLDQR